MTDLTDKWKKGELPEGVYYVLYYKNDTAEVDIYRRVYSLYDESEVRFTIPQVTKVLAPVPSYEEWEKLNWYAGNGVEENIKLKTENKWYSEQLNEAVKKIDKLKEQQKIKADCKTLAQKLLQVKPELRDWLEVNFKEYL